MLELLIALLVFSVGMMGLLTAQLVGKKAVHEASQRSVATALARDILERIRANPLQIESYRVTNVGDEARRLLLPAANCDASACSAAQLAAFDLWEWESLLAGESEKFSGGYAGGLLSPRACISGEGGTVAVSISWLGLGSAPNTVENTVENKPATGCGDDLTTTASPTEATSTRQRHQLTLTTFIGGH